MTMAAAPRKPLSIHDYPEHLNPFHEDDNHNKIRFWTIGKKLSRSNSITFSGLKDIRNSWTLRSFMRKGKKGDSSKSKAITPTPANEPEPSPIAFRRSLQYSSSRNIPSSTTGGPTPTARTTVVAADRYEYGGSITPLPRSRFQERIKSTTPNGVQTLRGADLTPRMARSDITGSRLSIESNNPFEDEGGPIPPVRASRRKKKRAPPPPPTISAGSSPTSSTQLETKVVPDTKDTKRMSDPEIENDNINVELKIVEDEDTKEETKVKETKTELDVVQETPSENETLSSTDTTENTNATKIEDKANNNDEVIGFPKVNIVKYRRNSSINENDIHLQRDPPKEFTPLATRSKSLTNTVSNNNYVTYDINLNTDDTHNQNEVNSNESIHRVVCKYDVMARKQSVDTVSSTEREFIDLDKATKEIEREVNKLNSALMDDDLVLSSARLSVVEMKKRFDAPNISIPNPIPKPKRSLGSPIDTST